MQGLGEGWIHGFAGTAARNGTPVVSGYEAAHQRNEQYQLHSGRVNWPQDGGGGAATRPPPALPLGLV